MAKVTHASPGAPFRPRQVREHAVGEGEKMRSARRSALVTGAGRGIGRGIALALAEAGWAVVINYRGNAATANETAGLVTEAGGEALVVQADIGVAADRARLVQAALERFGQIDLLVNNAGMAPRTRMDILETTEASYDEVMNVNLKGPFFLTQLVARTMLEAAGDGSRQCACAADHQHRLDQRVHEQPGARRILHLQGRRRHDDAPVRRPAGGERDQRL